MIQIVGKLSKRRGQERKRARERCASETATQREVMLAKHHQQYTNMYAFFSPRGERPVLPTIVRCPVLVLALLLMAGI